MRTKPSGFTLIELIVVMIIIGVLAVAVVPRFYDRTFQARGFNDQVMSMLRYAQKSAVAQRRNVCVISSGDVITLSLDPVAPETVHVLNCSLNLKSPTGEVSFTKTAPSGVTLNAAAFASSAHFAFTASGAPTAAATLSISTSDENHTITVEGETGYVH